MQRADPKQALTIGLFYQYVFDGIKSESRMPDEKKSERNKKIKALFLNQISPNLWSPFRSLLRELNSVELEDILFDNHTDELVSLPAIYRFPDEAAIHNEFIKLVDHYQFFLANTKQKEAAEVQFRILFRGCKLIADYVECNNQEDNSVAYLHAYKILVLFGVSISHSKKGQNPFSSIQDYTKQHLPNASNPIHDALTLDLPINQPLVTDLNGWQRFIKKYGYKAIEIFQLAPQISQSHAVAPQDIAKARRFSSEVTYASYEKYPELAALCKHYNMSEENFNHCLEIESQRKSSDNLPNIRLDGKEVGHQGYVLLKLPIDDPRAYLLGLIF